MKAWDTFAEICGGAAATLAGLLFVAVSIRIAYIARSQELRNRAAQTLSLFGTVLIVSVLIAIPGQAYRTLGAELVVLAVITGTGLHILDRRAKGERSNQAIARTRGCYSYHGHFVVAAGCRHRPGPRSARGTLRPGWAGIRSSCWRRHERLAAPMTLFSSASFTWGVILAVVPILAMLGILFTMPQYSQGVLGTNAMGSGLRLLPLVAGLIAGAVPAARIVRLVGAKVAVTAGFVLLAAGLFTGAMTSAGSSGLFVAAWMAVAGLGTGIAMATAMSAALVELSAEKSGVGSAVLQAVNKTGAPLGIAILGSVLSAGYLARLDLSGLPPAAAAAVRQSVFGGVAVAQKIHSAALLASVQTAFVHGMDMALLVSAGIALAGVVLTLVFLPASNAAKKTVQPVLDTDGEAVGKQPAITGQAA